MEFQRVRNTNKRIDDIQAGPFSTSTPLIMKPQGEIGIDTLEQGEICDSPTAFLDSNDLDLDKCLAELKFNSKT